ncbi:hypothetical protein ACFQPC_15235 [Herminiimonas glaciei]|uniref:Uncharacterized protein n=1 Tax=Herminiimonas glaciei TaxID=523788 RepID=A0ABW2IEY0_9BURK
MHFPETRPDRSDLVRYSNLLYLLASLFLVRVVGQAVQYWFPLAALPAFGDFQGSSLPYALLLSIQLLMLAFMYRAAWRLGSGKLRPNSRVGRWLMALGTIYMAGSLLRIMIGLTVTDAMAWFTSWIPAMFHVVLAAFILTLAIFHLRAKDNCA